MAVDPQSKMINPFETPQTMQHDVPAARLAEEGDVRTYLLKVMALIVALITGLLTSISFWRS